MAGDNKRETIANGSFHGARPLGASSESFLANSHGEGPTNAGRLQSNGAAPRARPRIPRDDQHRHPFHWAPFVLIRNSGAHENVHCTVTVADPLVVPKHPRLSRTSMTVYVVVEDGVTSFHTV